MMVPRSSAVVYSSAVCSSAVYSHCVTMHGVTTCKTVQCALECCTGMQYAVVYYSVHQLIAEVLKCTAVCNVQCADVR